MEKTKLKFTRNTIFIYVCIFFFCWFFFFSLTHGINFFWEDKYFFDNINSSVFTQPNLVFSAIFDTRTLYSIDYMHRPLQKIYWGTLASLFGQNILLFRIHNAIIPAILATILFWIVKKYQNNFFGFVAMLYFIVSTSLFITILYTHDTRMYMHFLTVISLLLFLKYTKEKNIWLQYTLTLAVVLLSRLSLLFKHEGRIVFPIIILFVLFRKRDIFKRSSFLFLITLLAISTLPLFCFIEKTCTGMGLSFLIDFFLKFYTVIYIIGWPTSLLLCMTLLSIIYFYFSKYELNKNTLDMSKTAMTHATDFSLSDGNSSFRSRSRTMDQNTRYGLKPIVLDILFLSFIWLFFELLLAYAAKGFDLSLYKGSTLQRLDFAMSMFPLTLLIFSSVKIVNKAIKSIPRIKKVFFLLFFVLITTSVAMNAKDLNAWRGGWGEYFLGWNVVREYVDSITENSLLVLHTPNFDVPFISFSTNNAVIKDVLDFEYVNKMSYSYAKIFGADRGSLPNSNVFKNCRILNSKDETIYGIIKERFLGIKPKQVFEICEYDIKTVKDYVSNLNLKNN